MLSNTEKLREIADQGGGLMYPFIENIKRGRVLYG